MTSTQTHDSWWRWRKPAASIVNVAVSTIITIILLLVLHRHGPVDYTAFLTVLLVVFLLLQWYFLLNRQRWRGDPGMLLLGLQYREEYGFWRLYTYTWLYWLSFTTITIPWLFLTNMLVLQLPCVLLLGNTLHGTITQVETIPTA